MTSPLIQTHPRFALAPGRHSSGTKDRARLAQDGQGARATSELRATPWKSIALSFHPTDLWWLYCTFFLLPANNDDSADNIGVPPTAPRGQDPEGQRACACESRFATPAPFRSRPLLWGAHALPKLCF